LVELALVLPLFLVLLLGLLDFGRVVWAHNAIRMNAEGASRFASVSAPKPDADIRFEAQRISPAVSYDPDVAITGEGGGSFYPDATRAVVEIEIEVPIVTPFVSQIVGGSVTVSVKSEELIH
jgi:Flp pilus assembly protein TadG